MYANNDYRTYLAHHGVVGMHWGIRRYQPYGEGGYNPKKKGKEREDRIRKKETARLEKRKKKEAARLEKSKKREDRAFNEKYKKNFVKSYNEATNKFNRDIKGINEKYKNVTFDENFSTKEGQEYVKEVSAMWKKHYRDSLYKNVGEGTRNIGKDWVENASFMNEYDKWIKK